MTRCIALVTLTALFCVACAAKTTRFAGQYDPRNHVFSNDTVGFELALSELWIVYTKKQDFTAPIQLQSDQEEVLEAFESASTLSLVVVVQEGPLIEIAELVKKMQTFPETSLTSRLTLPQAGDVRQRAVRATTVNGHEAVEWIYTVQDETGGQPIDVTVRFLILKVGTRYVYLSFSAPSAQYDVVQPTMQGILSTFRTHALGV